MPDKEADRIYAETYARQKAIEDAKYAAKAEHRKGPDAVAILCSVGMAVFGLASAMYILIFTISFFSTTPLIGVDSGSFAILAVCVLAACGCWLGYKSRKVVKPRRR